LLFTAERNWAHAQNFKKINVDKKGTEPWQKYHAWKKLKKAVKASKELYDLVLSLKIDP